MHTDQTSLKALKFAGCTSILSIALLASSATARPLGKYAGSSTQWRPDYIGTIRMVQTDGKQQVYSAIADVELQAKPNPHAAIDPNPDTVQYEMRGQITVTSPVKLGELTCTAAPSTPVSIKDSGMNLYQGAEFGAGTAYEVRIIQFIRTPDCVTSDGKIVRSEYQTIQVNFDSSYQSAAQSEAALRALAIPTAEDQAAMREQQQVAEAAMNDPEVQQAMAQLEEMARSGKRPSEAEMIALAERLQPNPRVAQIRRPKLSPALEAQANQAVDYSHLKRTRNPDHLKDEMTLDFGAGRGSQTFSWDLRRVR